MLIFGSKPLHGQGSKRSNGQTRHGGHGSLSSENGDACQHELRPKYTNGKPAFAAVFAFQADLFAHIGRKAVGMAKSTLVASASAVITMSGIPVAMAGTEADSEGHLNQQCVGPSKQRFEHEPVQNPRAETPEMKRNPWSGVRVVTPLPPGRPFQIHSMIGPIPPQGMRRQAADAPILSQDRGHFGCSPPTQPIDSGQ
jgi:hypothetical protein